MTSWDWAFGDGTHSSLQQPVHLYASEGTYTVNLTVSGPSGSDSEVKTNYITVKTPAQAVQDLIIKVDGLGLPKGIEQSLLAKLDVAQKKITKEQYTPARNTLNAFINEVNAQRGKTVTVSQANELIAIAQRIINSIPGK